MKIIDLTGRRAVVTGSTSGIGFAIAHGLAEAGASVVINGRTQQNVEQAGQRLLDTLPQAKIEGVAADMSRADGISAFIRHAPEADILVNNLGIFEAKPFASITDDDWQRFFDTNVMSASVCRATTCRPWCGAAGVVLFSFRANPVCTSRPK